MDNRRTIVVTSYGHNKTIDKITVSLFEDSYYKNQSSDAETYCNAINTLEVKGDSWIFAKILSENTQYELDAFLPLKFSDLIMKLDDRAIQKILRKLDFWEIVKSLKDQDERVQDKIFANMSKRASKIMKEEMSYSGPLRMIDVKKSQEKIINVIRDMEQCGEIIIPFFKGETTE